MITSDEIKRVARLMRIELNDYDENTAKIQKMIEYFDHLDAVDYPDSFKRRLTVSLDSLRKDVSEASDSNVASSLKFRGGEHMHSPKLR